jgi:hypothetical protein
MFYRWDPIIIHLRIRLQAISFNQSARILHHLLLNIFRVLVLFVHAVFPSAFRLQVNTMIQESPSKFFPTVSGISGRVSRRTQPMGVEPPSGAGPSARLSSRCAPPSLLLLSRLRKKRLPTRPHLRPFPVRSGRDVRLWWQERLVRHARPLMAGQVTIRLFGIPEGLATSLDLATASHRLDCLGLPSSRSGMPIFAEPPGLFSQLFLHSSHLLPFWLSILRFPPPPTRGASRSAQLSFIR